MGGLGKAAGLGLTSFMLPEEVGGGGMTDCLTGCIVQEELCRGCAGIGNLITSGGFFAEPIVELGSEEQQRRWLEPIAGERPPLTALATTEPGSGSDAASIATTATKDGNVPPARAEDLDLERRARRVLRRLRHRRAGLALARDHGLRRREGRSGITFGEPMRKMGQRAIVNTEMFLEDAELPEDRRLGDEGQGFYGLMRTFDRSRITLGASATGIARAALEYAVEYAKSREQFGKPISEHQAVAFRLADMATRVDAARLLVHRAARRIDAGESVPKEAAMAKLSPPRRPCGAPGRRCRRSAAGAIPASTRWRSGCATPSWRRSRKARPTSSG